MNRFNVLLKKELIYGSLMLKIMMYAFALFYGLLFGFLSRLSDLTYRYIYDMLPMIIAFVGAGQILQSISADKKERTGEMILTTGINFPMYIMAKLLSCIMHTIIGVLLFYIVYVSAAGRMLTEGISCEDIVCAVLMSAVMSIFYCCTAIMARMAKLLHKIVILAFILVVISLVVLAFFNAFFVVSFMTLLPEYLLWTLLFIYGVGCLAIGIRFLAVRDFVGK